MATRLRLIPINRRVRRGQLLGGRYRMKKWVANGGMSEVWSARDEKLGRYVAAKVATCRPGMPGIALLEHEARLLSTLDHPGIIRAYDVGQDGDIGYLVMPLLSGTPLRGVIDRIRIRRLHDPAPLCAKDLMVAVNGEAAEHRTPADNDWHRTVVRIMVELLHAVEAAHAGSVLHRDLKPGNVVLTSGGHPVLVDFGLGGRSDKPGPDADRLTGTPALFAPEQIRNGRSGADARTDVYQLGLLLQEFLTLEPVFPESEIDIAIRIERGEGSAPRDVDPKMPRSLEAMCLRARASQPSERYQSVAALRADLTTYLKARPFTAIPKRWLGWWVRRGEVASWA